VTPPNVAIVEWIRRAFDFRGRSSRSDYWWVQGLTFSVTLVLTLTFMEALGPDGVAAVEDWANRVIAGDADAQALFPLEWSSIGQVGRFAFVFLMVFLLLTFIPSLSLAWRRFQDMNLPGWIHLIFAFAGLYVPLVGLVEAVWFIRPGTVGPNRYGGDPVRRH
jgi:uncharacterized membrane protein YhaH (DUF805 family)